VESEAYEFDLKLDGLTMVGRLTCKKCGQTTAFRGAALAVGSTLRCPCGQVSVTLAGDDLTGTQKALDDLESAFKKLGK